MPRLRSFQRTCLKRKRFSFAFRMCALSLSLVLVGAIVLSALPVRGLSSTSLIKRSSSAIAITADGATLLVVNPDSNSLTLVDTASRSVVAELPVGVDPRTVAVDDVGRRAYVANRGVGHPTAHRRAERRALTVRCAGNRYPG